MRQEMVPELVQGRHGRPPAHHAAVTRPLGAVSMTCTGDATKSFGMFSCSKTTNELNYAAQKFVRVVIGCNHIDSCNRT